MRGRGREGGRVRGWGREREGRRVRGWGREGERVGEGEEVELTIPSLGLC